MESINIENKPGIYKITNLLNQKFYIGSAYDCRRRVLEHINRSKKGTHHNEHLVRSFEKYGMDNFIFEVMEYVDIEDLIIKEQFYLDTLLFAQDFIYKNNRKFEELGYNMCPIASSPLGIKRSEETKRRMSESMKGFQRLDQHAKAIIQYDMNMNFIKEWRTIQSAADELKINRLCITQCCNGKGRHGGGFIWRFKGKENLEYKYKYFPILQLNENKEIINEFHNALIAANTLELDRRRLGEAIKKESIYKGFYWKKKITN